MVRGYLWTDEGLTQAEAEAQVTAIQSKAELMQMSDVRNLSVAIESIELLATTLDVG